ncbi:MAG: amidohydrolase family protein [Fervidicoccaceae archaeon]
MGRIEVEELFYRGELYYDVSLELPGKISGSYRSAISPGLSDAHAHPQVIDVGEGGIWKNSYEWISKRKLRVREGDLRKDARLSSEFAEATLKLSILDGITMMAMTGSLHGNLDAVRRMKARPRTVILPTVMNREGWLSAGELRNVISRGVFMDGGKMMGGIFIHSLNFTDPISLKEALSLVKSEGIPLSMHLNEGIEEAERLRKLVGDDVRGIAAVHCIEETEKCRELGLKIISCPISNLYLYGKTIESLSFVDAFGSDWPLVTGTMKKVLSKASEIYGISAELLRKATVGGYEVFGMRHEGDFAFYDEPLSSVASGKSEPKLVLIGWEEMVIEGKVEGEGKGEVEKKLKETIEDALAIYGM